MNKSGKKLQKQQELSNVDDEDDNKKLKSKRDNVLIRIAEEGTPDDKEKAQVANLRLESV